MAVGYRTFSSTQLAVEAAAGTDLAATEVWRGPVVFPEDDRTMVFPPEDVAIGGGTDRSNVTALLAKIAFPACDLTFEQGPYPFLSGIKNVSSGVADGAGTDYIYAYPLATTAPPTIKTLTVEGYDNIQEYETNYFICQHIKITGKRREALQIAWDGIGQAVTAASKTGSLSLPSVESVNFGNGAFYLDASSGTPGTTQKTLTMTGFEIDIDCGVFPIYTDGNSLKFGMHKAGAWDGKKSPIKGKFMFEHNSTSVTEFSNYQSQTTRLARLNFPGSALVTPGTAYSTRLFRADLPIKWTKRTFGVEDGDNIVTMDWESRYNATYGSSAVFTFVNERASL